VESDLSSVMTEKQAKKIAAWDAAIASWPNNDANDAAYIRWMTEQRDLIKQSAAWTNAEGKCCACKKNGHAKVSRQLTKCLQTMRYRSYVAATTPKGATR
jgi:hypothetical protein